jgi:hypothetical protein
LGFITGGMSGIDKAGQPFFASVRNLSEGNDSGKLCSFAGPFSPPGQQWLNEGSWKVSCESEVAADDLHLSLWCWSGTWPVCVLVVLEQWKALSSACLFAKTHKRQTWRSGDSFCSSGNL